MSFQEAYNETSEQIFKLTGIKPDERYHIPVEEQRLIIEDVQAGDPAAMETLISQRLRWMYEKFLPKPEIQERFDLEPEDVMQLGALAVIEAAKKVDPNSKNVSSDLRRQTATILGNLVMEEKLVPSVTEDENSRASYNAAKDESRMTDSVDLLPDSELIAAIEEDRTAVPQSVEREVFEKEIEISLKEALKYIHPRHREVLEQRFGITTQHPQTLDGVGRKINVTRETVRRIENDALKRLYEIMWFMRDFVNIKSEDVANRGAADESTYAKPYIPKNFIDETKREIDKIVYKYKNVS